MFALSLVDFLSLLLSPSTYFNIFNLCQKYHLNYTYKIFKKFHVGLKFEWGLSDQYWLSCERLPFEVFFSCLCEGLQRIAYANMLVTTQWPLKRAATSPHLSGFVFYGCLGSLTELSALCVSNGLYTVLFNVTYSTYPRYNRERKVPNKHLSRNKKKTVPKGLYARCPKCSILFPVSYSIYT